VNNETAFRTLYGLECRGAKAGHYNVAVDVSEARAELKKKTLYGFGPRPAAERDV
jgi:hypothetical protein